MNGRGVYAIESIPDRRLQYSMHVTFDESSFPALSLVVSGSVDDNSVRSSSKYDSSSNGESENSNGEVDISDLEGDGSNSISSDPREISLNAPILG